MKLVTNSVFPGAVRHCYSGAAIKVMVLIFLLCSLGYNGFSTAWTTSVAGNINTLANWSDGTISPTTFTTPGDTWTITMSMSLPPSSPWIVGTMSMTPDTVTFATGGTLSMSGAGSSFPITIFGEVYFTGGTLSLGGAGTNSTVNIYGDVIMSSGTVSSVASSTALTVITNGNYNITGGTVTTTGASSTILMKTYGDFVMTAGSIVASGAGGVITNNIYGNCSIIGPSAMTNVGAGCTNTVHFALPSSSGMMQIDNTSTGVWSGTNVYVDSNCTAILDGNFSSSTGSGGFGVTVNGTLICPTAYVLNGTGIFKLNGVATLEVANAAGINGAILTTGTKTFANSANYVFNGIVPQVTGSYLPASLVAPDSITIANGSGVTLSQTTSTTGTLLFTSGILNTSTFTMSVPGTPSAVIGAGPSSYVDGTLIKTISGFSTVNYEVGDVDFAPMLLTFSSPGTGGSLGVMATAGLHPFVSTSGLSTSFMANHYWTITNIGAAGPASVSPTAIYNLIDIIGGSNSAFLTQQYSSTAWLSAGIVTTNTTVPYTSTPNTGFALGLLAGDFIFGDNFCGTLPITGTPAVCVMSTTSLSDATTGGTWLSSNAGIASVSSSGIVTGGAAGTAVISYTATGCTTILTVTVNPMPNAGTISGPSSVCVGRTINLSDGSSGGAWTSSSIDATVSAAGVVTGITPGSAVISYTVSNSCGTATATQPLTVVSIAMCALQSANTANLVTVADLKIFPNPNNGTFTVNLNSPDNNLVNISVTNLLGEKIMELNTLTNKDAEIKLNYAPGVYMVTATDESGKYNSKVVIE